jgi:signal peptidase I
MDNQNQTPTQPTPTPQQHPLDAPAPRTLTAPTGSSPTPAQPLFAATGATDPDPSPSPLSNIANGFASIFGAIFSWIIFPVAVVLILHNFVFQAYHVLGTSMVPTLHETDYLIISKLGYTQALVERAFKKDKAYIPGRGQIIVFRYPKDPSKVFVKRVIGLPGDRIVIKNGTVTVFNNQNKNGFNPDTGYEKSDATTLIDTDEVVQDGNVFVMGDNRTPGGSYDSREWGELPSSYIIGNAVLRLLPLDQVRAL